MMKESIRSERLSVNKGRACVLDALDFTIVPGLITGLIGPSGSGKTTLMRSIVGVQAITEGSLSVLGYPAGSKVLRPKIGYVTQNPAVYDDLTVVQNLHYFAVIAKVKKSVVAEVISNVHLDDKAHQLVGTLSGGQRARVSLAVALLGSPDLLVLDEPTVGLDPILRRDLWALFAELADQGKTVLISSHVMDEADRCDRILLLHEGKLLWQNARDELLQHTKTKTIEAAFIAMIQAEGKI